MATTEYKDAPQPRYDPQRRCMTLCQADDDGYCEWKECPQLRDDEPEKTGRHCPLDTCNGEVG